MGNRQSGPAAPGAVIGESSGMPQLPPSTDAAAAGPQESAAAAAPADGGSRCPMNRGRNGGQQEEAGQQQPHQGQAQSESKCPMKRGKPAAAAAAASTPAAPAPAAAQQQQQQAGGGGCPVKYKHSKQYNVYGQEIDPTNQMPATAAQHKAPGQQADLSTEREPSTIPKGGSEGTWTYPSPQMFWNALTRKGKVEGTEERDMDMVVAVHNNMNEKTWAAIQQWEEVAERDPGDGTGPRLLHFQGRPDDLSPKAWLRTLFGYVRPFDRHDWVVDRGGRTRRYVIDYYHSDAAAAAASAAEQKEEGAAAAAIAAEAGALSSRGHVQSIVVDVRPAVDSVSDAVFRFVKMPAFRRFAMTPHRPLPFFLGEAYRPGAASLTLNLDLHTSSAAQTSSEDAEYVAKLLRAARKRCAKRLETLKLCEDAEAKGEEGACARAAVGLTYCMATLACKVEAVVFDAVTATEGGDVEGAFEAMQACLAGVEQRARAAQGGGGGGGDSMST